MLREFDVTGHQHSQIFILCHIRQWCSIHCVCVVWICVPNMKDSTFMECQLQLHAVRKIKNLIDCILKFMELLVIFQEGHENLRIISKQFHLNTLCFYCSW